MSRYVTFHPWGHEPADSLVLAGVLRAVWAVHEVPLLLELQADGSIVIGDGQPVPVAEPEEDQDDEHDEFDAEAEAAAAAAARRTARRLPAPDPVPASAPTPSPPRTPANPGGGIGPLGPIERRPVDHEAARLRAAGEV